MLSPRPGWFFFHLIIKILFLTIRKKCLWYPNFEKSFQVCFHMCTYILCQTMWLWSGPRCVYSCMLCVCVCVYVCVCVCVRCSVMSDSLRPTRPLCSWSSPGKNTGVSSYFLLQGIFLTQGLNLGIPHCRQILYHLNHQESQWVYTLMGILWTVAMKWRYWLVYHECWNDKRSQHLWQWVSSGSDFAPRWEGVRLAMSTHIFGCLSWGWGAPGI